MLARHCRSTLLAFVALQTALAVSPAVHAWNALGHKTIAEIAWQELAPERRQEIITILRRHPRFDEDFAKQLPADVEEDRWIFWQAAVWPDLARGFSGEDRKLYDHPTWHYINFPLFVGGERPLFDVNRSVEYPTPIEQSKWNIIQAIKHCQATLAGDAAPSDKALAYCWLFHLVGDLHQPLHSTALFSERFPTGDRGGNLIQTLQGRNLHSLWDGLLGRRHRPRDVNREAAELRTMRTERTINSQGSVEDWIKESHEIAKTVAYTPEVIAAAEAAGQGEKITLSEEYLRKAGEQARRRIVAAGLRLAALLE